MHFLNGVRILQSNDQRIKLSNSGFYDVLRTINGMQADKQVKQQQVQCSRIELTVLVQCVFTHIVTLSLAVLCMLTVGR